MKKLLLSCALAFGALLCLSSSPAHAQDIGVTIGGERGSFSFYYGDGPRYYHRDRGGYYHRPPYYHPRPVYRAPITVLVYETVTVREWCHYTRRWVWRQRTVERWVTAYWSNYYGCYGYTDRYGHFRCVR